MKNNILKIHNIKKVNKENSDIVVKEREKFCPNTYRVRTIKTDGVILRPTFSFEVKVIGSTVTAVTTESQQLSEWGHIISRGAYSTSLYTQKWVTEKDMARLSSNYNEMEIDGVNYRIHTHESRYINTNGGHTIKDGDFGEYEFADEIVYGGGLEKYTIIKTDGQVYEVDKYKYIRNASYMVRIQLTASWDNKLRKPQAEIKSVDISVDFDRATAKTLKDIRDDFRIASYEAKKKCEEYNLTIDSVMEAKLNGWSYL